MGIPGATELIIILGIVVLVFGGKKIPELMKGLGSGIKNFKSAVKEDEKMISNDEQKDVQTPSSTTVENEVRERTKQA